MLPSMGVEDKTMFTALRSSRCSLALAVAGSLLMALVVVGPTNAWGNTVVSGVDDANSAIEIDPTANPTDPQEMALPGSGTMVVFITAMPRTRTVNEVTVGDLRIEGGSSCPAGQPSESLEIREHPTGAANVQTPIGQWSAKSIGRSVVPTSSGKVSFAVPPGIDPLR